MILSDMHVHSNFCDGVDTPEILCETALKKGIKNLGIVAHSYVDFNPVGTLNAQNKQIFIDTVNNLKSKYNNLNVYVGLELDALSNVDTSGFDFIIGSMHYVSNNGKTFTFDNGEDLFKKGVEEVFDGDYYLFIEKYFNDFTDFLLKTKPDIIGHLDLVTKYNEGNKYFDTNSPRYINAYKKAVDRLINLDAYFEVNFGALNKGIKTSPYPEKQITDYILSKGGKIVLASDAHTAKFIGEFKV